MNAAVFLLLCVGVVLGGEIDPQVIQSWLSTMDPFKDKCMNETHADPLLVEVIMKTGVISTNHEVMCFAKCIFMDVDVMDKDGNVNIDVVVKKGVVVKPGIAEKCINESESEPDLCKKAHDFAMCVVRELVKGD
ncbi:hypothetical protein RN001_002177 [Aquatica leii]|uniref:Uncharacterized protein n=1 Tax=Aquatica leii TaxID=1421715 RepID=A0AAN7PPJ9_9COLE|nr:hypothetical protein RN001_002177 [Aquatica leii]